MRERGQCVCFSPTGFGPPNMAEMGRFGVFGQAFFIPNTELNEERTRALEGTFTLQMAGRVQTSVRFFLQALSGWLALQPASYRGQSAVGGLPVYQYQATEEVVMLGAEATLAWQIIGGWSLRAEIGWLDEMGNGIARPPTPDLAACIELDRSIAHTLRLEGLGRDRSHGARSDRARSALSSSVAGGADAFGLLVDDAHPR
jgi:hypothetical protein